MSTINGNVCVANGVAVDKVFSNGRQVYGRNLLRGASGPFVMGYGIPNTTWDTTNQVSKISLPFTKLANEVLPQDPGFLYTYMPGVTYTQSIYISTDAPLTGIPIKFNWFTYGHGRNVEGVGNTVKVSTKNIEQQVPIHGHLVILLLLAGMLTLIIYNKDLILLKVLFYSFISQS